MLAYLLRDVARESAGCAGGEGWGASFGVRMPSKFVQFTGFTSYCHTHYTYVYSSHGQYETRRTERGAIQYSTPVFNTYLYSLQLYVRKCTI